MLTSRLAAGLTLTLPHGVDTAHEARATLSAATINNTMFFMLVYLVIIRSLLGIAWKVCFLPRLVVLLGVQRGLLVISQ